MTNKLPIDYPLAHNVKLQNGTILVKLPTLDELLTFWEKHKQDDSFQFAATGKPLAGKLWFLKEYEWVFGPSKDTVIDTIFRWDRLGVKATFNDLRESDPNMLELIRSDTEGYRENSLANEEWSPKDEADYQEFMDRYVGDWELINLPRGLTTADLLRDAEAIQDKDASPEWVIKQFQIQLFDDMSVNGGIDWDVETMTASKVEEFIRYWESERADNCAYYGQENENSDSSLG